MIVWSFCYIGIYHRHVIRNVVKGIYVWWMDVMSHMSAWTHMKEKYEIVICMLEDYGMLNEKDCVFMHECLRRIEWEEICDKCMNMNVMESYMQDEWYDWGDYYAKYCMDR